MVKFNWTYEELVLAADLVARNGWKGLKADTPAARELSSLLRAATFHPTEGRPDNFRSANSVQRKTFDIATRHPAYTGKPTRGASLAEDALLKFLEDPSHLSALANEIRTGINGARLSTAGTMPDLEFDVLEAREGSVRAAAHLRRERSSTLRKAKLEAVIAGGGVIRCEVCLFDFAKTYGDLGEGFIEVHHVLPLHESGPVSTRLEDLALLCPNCHRMIHRSRKWITPDELRRQLRE